MADKRARAGRARTRTDLERERSVRADRGPNNSVVRRQRAVCMAARRRPPHSALRGG